MRSKPILDAFSESLMQDERILSSRERELLMSLLRNAKEATGNSEVQTAVTAAIARSVGETVAQRTFALLGSSIVEQIVARGLASSGTEAGTPARMFAAGPQPPSQSPRDMPGGPQPPAESPLEKPAGPQPPAESPLDKPSGPQPPSGLPAPSSASRPASMPVQATKLMDPDSGRSVAVLERPAVIRPQCVVLDEFLTPQEMEELIRYTLDHEAGFAASEVISPSGEPGVADYTHRRSRVLMDLGPHKTVILDRIRTVLSMVLHQLGMEEFPITRTEAQITASKDGDLFQAHSDDAQATVASRRITFVYFFHREPCQFEGGELRLHDSSSSNHLLSAGSYRSIVPQQNQIVLFPSSTMHEITLVHCPSRVFADSRFTVNGWLHR
jgi:Rps23 Pro-64 3,4-dihydroxylase Tpa1-like proline 4-hydroxylase